MLCKRTDCDGDMKYYKTIDSTEGYRCPICGFRTIIVAHDISEIDDLPSIQEFVTVDANGCLCIDDGAIDAWYKASPA